MSFPSAAGYQGELAVPLGDRPRRAGKVVGFGEAGDAVLGAGTLPGRYQS
ncbi:hypothetical protein ACIRU3_38545 [Streptomyces sp. NPDC101151]